MAIDVRIDPRADGGLRVITHIPPERPCRLEGRNGIGKSVAIRLLVLVSGRQSYEGEPASWRSLKKLVGPTEIHLSGLVGAHRTATVTLTPTEWPEEPALEIGEWLGVLRLDGAPAPLSELFAALRVEHLSGTERLVDTLTRHRARFKAALVETRTNLLRVEEQRARLGELEETFSFLSPESERRDSEAFEELGRRLAASAADFAARKDRLDQLQRAALLGSMLASSSGDRQQALKEARDRSASAQATLASASARLDAAIRALSRGTQQQKKVAVAEDRLRGLVTEIAEARNDRVRAAAAADLHEVAETAEDRLSHEHHQLVEAEIAEAERLASTLRRRLYEAQLTTEQAEIRNELTVVLDGAVDAGHGEFIAARLDDRDVRIAELRDGVARAAVTYEPPESGAALAAAIDRHQHLLAIRRAEERIAAANEQSGRLQDELRALKEASASDDLTAEVESARQARDGAQADAQMAAIRVGQLSSGLLTGAAGEDALGQVNRILAEQDVRREELGEATADALAQVTALEAEVAEIESARSRLRDSEARRSVRRRDWAVRLAASNEYAWLLTGLTWDDRRPDRAPWGALARRVALARATANQLTRDVEGLEAALGDPRSSEYADAGRQAVEREGLADFSEEHVRAALFDGGQVEALDLRDQTVTWQTPSGERRTRPLSAFSSGEQALGFIRARLRQLTATEAANRLVFLDEFGAFVAADRRKPLAELLADDAVNPLSAQIIVVLPLQVDYAMELPHTRGDLQRTYEARARQVEQRGYFAERFDA